MSKKYNINTLVSKLITCEITEEEGKALLEKAEEDPSLKSKIDALLEENDLVSRYKVYRSINAEEAKEKFIEEIEEKRKDGQRHSKLIWMTSLVAAAILALFVINDWLAPSNQKKLAPEITAEINNAIERVQQNGMNGATFIVNGKKMPVNNAQVVQAEAEQIDDNHSVFGSDDIVEGSLVTKNDKEFWMVLDDGTYVHLNYSTTLVYPTRFSGNERRVKLSGEAYFVVAKDAKNRPFIVETTHGDVHDYGTEFNVNTVRTQGVTSVVLVKGKVGVSSKHGKEYLLKPGEMAELQNGRTPNINKVDVNLFTSWNTGNFFFDGCTLDKLMIVISNWYGKKVEFASDDIKNFQFTGSIDKYEPMYQTLHAIETITGLKLDVKDNNIFISRDK